MLEAITSELVVDLREAFPHLIIEKEQSIPNYFTLGFDDQAVSWISVWLCNDGIIMSAWSEHRVSAKTACSYSDPEAFDLVQSFISEHYHMLIADKRVLKC